MRFERRAPALCVLCCSLFTALLLRRKYVLWRCALVCERFTENHNPGPKTHKHRQSRRFSVHSLVRRRKYVLWRCALVCSHSPGLRVCIRNPTPKHVLGLRAAK